MLLTGTSSRKVYSNFLGQTIAMEQAVIESYPSIHYCKFKKKHSLSLKKQIEFVVLTALSIPLGLTLVSFYETRNQGRGTIRTQGFGYIGND